MGCYMRNRTGRYLVSEYLDPCRHVTTVSFLSSFWKCCWAITAHTFGAEVFRALQFIVCSLAALHSVGPRPCLGLLLPLRASYSESVAHTEGLRLDLWREWEPLSGESCHPAGSHGDPSGFWEASYTGQHGSGGSA